MLLHSKHAGFLGDGPIYMESPLHQRGVIDIDATVEKNRYIIPGLRLLPMTQWIWHRGLLLRDQKGKSSQSSARRYYTFGSELLFILDILRKSNLSTKSFHFPPGTISFRFLGDSNLPMTAYYKIIDEATTFILACYHLSGMMALTEARVDAWKTKMWKSVLEPPKPWSLPTASSAFREHALWAHYQLAVWRDTLHQSPPSLTATDHGWSEVEGHANITPTIVPSALHWLKWNCWISFSVDLTATCHVPAIGVDAWPMASSAPCSACVEEAMAAATICDPFKATTKLFLNLIPLNLL